MDKKWNEWQKKQAYQLHARNRLKDRYDLELSSQDRKKLVSQIERHKHKYIIESQRNNRLLMMVPYRGAQIVVVYDNRAKMVVTALPALTYFGRVKLLKGDKDKILSGRQTSVWHVVDKTVSIRRGRKLLLYVKGDRDPFALVKITSRVKKKVKDLVGKSIGRLSFHSEEELIEYLSERYDEEVTPETTVKIGFFSEPVSALNPTRHLKD